VSVPEDPSGRPQPVPPPDPAPAPSRVSLATVLREWGRIGCIGFGGPPTHIKLLRELCVERRKWLEAQEFEDAIAACNLLPGPASTQLAIFCAWRLRGRLGALVGGEPARNSTDRARITISPGTMNAAASAPWSAGPRSSCPG